MSLTVNGVTTRTVALKKGEIKNFSFTYNITIAAAVFTLEIKQDKDVTPALITINDGDFDKSEIGSDKISAIIDTSSLSDETLYFLEVTADFGATHKDKTVDLILDIGRAVTS